MSRLKDTNFFTLHGWMVNQLHLKGGELSAYALVHQFTQSEAGIYTGGVPYLAEWIGCGLTSARKYLHTLEDKGLIVHEDGFKNGVPFRYYKVVDSHIPQILEDTPQKVEGDTSNIGGSTPQKLEVEYNKDNKKENKKKKVIKEEMSFSYYDALISLGVTPQTATDFLAVRKSKKALDTLTSFNGLKNQIAKSGMSAEECIRIATENNWKWFKVAWLDNIPSKSADSKPKSFFERYK